MYLFRQLHYQLHINNVLTIDTFNFTFTLKIIKKTYSKQVYEEPTELQTNSPSINKLYQQPW